jgi:hypothetical protein
MMDVFKNMLVVYVGWTIVALPTHVVFTNQCFFWLNNEHFWWLSTVHYVCYVVISGYFVSTKWSTLIWHVDCPHKVLMLILIYCTIVEIFWH